MAVAHTISWRGALFWWLESLWACLPTRVRAILTTPPRAIIFEPDGPDRFQVSAVHAPDKNVIFDARGITTTSLRQSFGRDVTRGARFAIAVPSSQCLTTQLRLPVAAIKNLAGAIHYELERWIPYHPDDVFVSYSVAPHRRGATHLDINVTCASKDTIADGARDLSQAGLMPYWVLLGSEVPSLDALIPLDPQRFDARIHRSSRLTAALAALACLLIAANLYVRFDALATEQDLLQSRIQILVKSHREAEEIEKAIEIALNRASFLKREQKSRPRLSTLLNDVAHALPSEAWLESILYDAGTLTIEGVASDAAALHQALANSIGANNVRFASPVIRDPNNGADRFSLKLAASDAGN